MAEWEDSSTRSWDAVAEDWVAHADENDYRNVVLMPVTLELLGDVAGRELLDLGCGEGGYARQLAARGAHVVGVDGSARLLEVARQRSSEAGLVIEYVHANAASLEPIESGRFDVVLAAMSLMDVEDYERSISEVRRVLAVGGTLLMSITHPCFSAPISRWCAGESDAAGHFAVDRYFDRAVWDDFITLRFRRPVLRRHRPLEDFIRPLLASGFVLRDFREPSAADEHVARSPRLAHLKRIPYFLFMSWHKPEHSLWRPRAR